MLGNLFDDEEAAFAAALEESLVFSSKQRVPPRPRLHSNFAGIANQGATCYLNSLLQTLFLTPEFRRSLFQLPESELGLDEDGGVTGKKLRIIPLELQRLFARLLLSNRQAVSTAELTESFGWTNNEELQQHDVQELNRILFSAIEDSLVGTTGQELIQHLYHGTIVNQIICLLCGNVSEREEDFLDLTLSVAGCPGLEYGLQNAYCEMEVMDGQNQYRCGKCQKLVNAKKGARIRCLPPILTVSLLRFSYDFKKMERYKETGQFTFPTTVDMSLYTDQPSLPEDMVYELFSVVIHRGGAYGGHYHAYIRDVDKIGSWINPDKAGVEIPADPSLGFVNFIECDSPVDVVQAILGKDPSQTLTIDKLCSEIVKQTGVSWNKRFKRHYGSINKFLKRYDDKFILNPAGNLVKLKLGTSKIQLSESCPEKSPHVERPPLSDAGDQEDSNKENKCPDGEVKTGGRPPSPVPPDGYCWFDFNDSRISPIKTKELGSQFSGKESAYMLFYRKKTLKISENAEPALEIPERLVEEMIKENTELEQQRKDYEIAVNTIKIQIHFGCHYQYKHGALKALTGQTGWMLIDIDRRKTVSELMTAVKECGGELVPSNLSLQRMQDLPSGYHLYDCLSDDGAKTLQELSLNNGANVFVWDGCKVQDTTIPTGVECEPVCLTILYGQSSQYSCGYSKNLILAEFKSCICDLTGIPASQIILKRLVGRDAAAHLVNISENQLSWTLGGLQLKDGDQIVAEDIKVKNEAVPPANIAPSNRLRITLENQCAKVMNGNSWPHSPVDIDSKATVAELKALAMTRFGLPADGRDYRVRLDHPSLGLRPPLCEDQTAEEAGLYRGSTIVLEVGTAPKTNQITLTFTAGDPKSDLPHLEMIAEKNMTVGTCLSCMIEKAGLTGDDWHLRKTNWCGEAAEILDDLDQTLEVSCVSDGDHILLEEGKLPPKGFIRLSVVLHPSPKVLQMAEGDKGGVMSWINNGIQGLFSRSSKSETETNQTMQFEPVLIGEVEICRNATLEDLKLQILTLPVITELPIPSPSFMRVRQLENGWMTTVLRSLSHSLRRLKLTSGSQIAVQILAQEELLSQNEVVLIIKKRVPNTRIYSQEQELVLDLSAGSGASCLQQAVADSLLLQVEHIVIAKHFPKRFEWLVIQDRKQIQKSGRNGKKGNSPKAISLKQAPYYLQDGDTIGVKDQQFDPDNKDNFTTEEDDLGQAEIKRTAEEKKKMREERKKIQDDLPVKQPKKHRPEVALTIKVDKFT